MSEQPPANELRGMRALVLDVDDTILDTRTAMTRAGTVAARALWPGPGRPHRQMAQRYYDDPGGWFRRYTAGEISVEQMRLARLRDVADAFRLDLAHDAGERYLAAYLPAFRGVQRLFGDVPALLAAADRLGTPVALLTNSNRVDTAIKLEALGLDARFDGLVVTTDTFGIGKPDRRVYLEACRLVAAEPARTVSIGDSLEWDVLGAVAAGLRGIWLDRGGSGGTGHAAIHTLDTVTAVLTAMA
ncbi:MAG: HAD family hydrolase [Intrasporangium sp.]|uniref:HAD family hydrolase n=1 Tax=Intrasporangium sp. TaxID=1925024 RepID=UPI002647F726|nr:HAD family hydrolase [Intrasporangium sp.]MDN5794721.1 HAD family hydrolase [Intrasporangium sp.]